MSEQPIIHLTKAAVEKITMKAKDGLRIFVNPQSVPFIKGPEIDYQDTLKQSGFQYKNPNAKSSCGCGSSFS